MKRFDIITESDARAIDVGSTVQLNAGGHVTPLADDTLRARRVTVLRNVLSADLAALPPPAEIRRVAIGGDHSGLTLKAAIVAHLRGKGIAVNDIGTHTPDPVDYPDIAAAIGRLTARGEVDAGIVIDGAGLGSTIAANKIAGVRAAMCNDRTLARYAREHNGANVLALGSTLVSIDDALAIVDTWLGTPMREPRYIRRLAKIQALDEQRTLD